MKSGHVIILTTIMVAVIGTFFAANVINGFAGAKIGFADAKFAPVTGLATGTPDAKQVNGLQAAMGAVLFGLVSIAALVVVARIGSNTYTEIQQKTTPRITDAVKKAEDALQAGKQEDAFALYGIIKQQYNQLKQEEKAEHYKRIINLHSKLSRQTAIMEAQQLTDKYVKGTITQSEFERLKELIISQ